MASPNFSQRRYSHATGVRIVILSPVLLFFLMVLGVGAWLRETPLFWQNAGGYPVWLRDAVFSLFYPWYALSLLGLVFWQCLMLEAALRTRWTVVPCILCTLFYWGIFCGINCVILSNNIVNLINGRSLHYH